MNKERYARLTPEQLAEHNRKNTLWRKSNKEKNLKSANSYYSRHKEKIRAKYKENYALNKDKFKEKRTVKSDKIVAQRAVNLALKNGNITRKPCQICGNEKVEAHHSSYASDKRLDVTWLCMAHHNAWHRVFLAD